MTEDIAPYDRYKAPPRGPLKGQSRAARQANVTNGPRVQRRLDGLLTIVQSLAPVPQRTVFYRATELMPTDYPKDSSKVARLSSQKLSDDINTLRRKELIGMGDVTDMVSSQYRQVWAHPGEVLSTLADTFRQEFWAEHPFRIAVTIESEQLWSALHPRLRDLPIPMFGLGGHASVPLKAELADWLDEADQSEDPWLLHVGDADGMGWEIERTLAADLDDLMFHHEARVERIWLYRGQAQELGLPARFLASKVEKAMDEAWTYAPGDPVFEAESGDPADIADVIRTEVERLLDPTVVAEVEKAEKEARVWFKEQADEWAA